MGEELGSLELTCREREGKREDDTIQTGEGGMAYGPF